MLEGMRRFAWASSFALLVSLVAEGCVPSAPASAQSSACGDVAWGGWSGSPSCRALSERVIPGTDRSCRQDADCATVHAGASCREQAVRRERAAAYEAMPAACTDPAGGPCPPRHAACVDGCCVATR